MAPTSSTSSTSTPAVPTPSPKQAASPKRLSELLQEKQDPFVLEIYLLERGYSKKSSCLEDTYGCFSHNYSSKNKLLKSSANDYGPKRRRKGRTSINSASDRCLNFARALLNKVTLINETIGLKSSVKTGDGKSDSTKKEPKSEEERAESERSSSSDSWSTELHSRSEIEEAENNTITNTGQLNHLQAREPVLQWKIVEENRDCSPVSVLDQIEPIPVYNNGHNSVKRQETSSASSFSYPKKATEEGIFSASLWELLVRSRKENSSGVVGTDTVYCSQYINSKKAMQQSKQLMFDCVREAVESQAKKQKRQGTEEEEKQLMCPEEIGKIICDNMIRSWGKQRGARKKLTQLIRPEIVGSPEEWCAFKGFGRGIGKEVGDRIWEEIKDELVEEMVSFCNT